MRYAAACVVTALAITGCALGQATEATDVGQTDAVLHGTVSAIESGPVEHWFQYGLTATYGSTTAHRSLTVNDHDPHPVSEPVFGLAPGTPYHFRLCARNAGQANPNCGGDKIFTTSGGRQFEDQPDDHPEGSQQIHVIYAIPSDGEDRGYDVDGSIAASVDVATQWMSDQTGGMPFRLDTANGALDVTFVQLDSTDEDLAAEGDFIRDEIEAQVEARGFDDGRKYYFVFYDGTADDRCGGASWPPELLGHVVAIYLKGQIDDPEAPDCDENAFAGPGDSPGYREFSFLHEIFHGLGAVPECAPNHTRAGHTGDLPNDLMYAGDDDWVPDTLDPGFDDYWGHGSEDCLDMATSGYLEGNDPAPVPGEDIDGNPL